MSQDRLFLFRLSEVLSFGSYKFYACCLSAALIYLFICSVLCVRFIRIHGLCRPAMSNEFAVGRKSLFLHSVQSLRHWLGQEHMVHQWARAPKADCRMPSFCLGAATRNGRTASKSNNKPNKNPNNARFQAINQTAATAATSKPWHAATSNKKEDSWWGVELRTPLMLYNTIFKSLFTT